MNLYPQVENRGRFSFRAKLVLCLLLTTAHGELRASQAAPSSPLAPASPAVQSAGATDVLHIAVGRSVMLTSEAALRRIYVGNPDVVRSYTSGQREVVLTAKAAGVSSLVLWDTSGGHRLYTLSCELDPAALRASIEDAFPGLKIDADTSTGKVVLSGAVPTEAIADGVVKLASLYSKDIVNSLQIVPVHPKQVQLKLRIVEVDRTRLEQMGINFFSGGKNATQTTTGQFSSGTLNTSAGSGASSGSSSFSVSNPLNLLFYNSSLNVGVNIQELEEKQILQVLAEPTLTTVSGQSARFLSGGEFPFPVVQGGTGSATAVTIVFKPYGVKVDFTPTVNPDGSIHLKVNPEVSTLDFSNSVTISGFTIPALSTRRAETEVEIKDGQSFVVSGLLDHRVTDTANKVPALGDIPLLGQVFRSKSFQHSVVELVVIVTAKIVDPLTNPETPVEPKFSVPIMDNSKFDAAMHKDWKTGDPGSKNVKVDQP